MTGFVITGLGVIAPTGLGVADHWSATLAGKANLAQVTRFDPSPYTSRLAGEVPGFDAAAHLHSRLLTQTDRMTQLALVASDWALADAGLGDLPDDGYGVGVVTASSSGGFEFGQRELQNLWSRGPGHVSAYQSFAWFYAVNSGQISIRHGLRGPSGVLVSDQAGGLDAIAQACRRLRSGTSAVLTGGVEGSLCPWGWAALSASGRMSRRSDPTRAYLPFDEDADGYVPGEGGAVLLLERQDAARDRGAVVHGRVLGYASSFDPHPELGEGSTLAVAIRAALGRARLAADDVDVVFADGAGVPAEDRAEAAALREVFGAGGVPVTVPKTMTGRLSSGAASLDVVNALLAIRDGVIPPTVHVTQPDPRFELDLVRNAPRPATLRTALVVARGHHGFNAVLVVASPDRT